MDKGRPDPVHEKENKGNDSVISFHLLISCYELNSMFLTYIISYSIHARHCEAEIIKMIIIIQINKLA